MSAGSLKALLEQRRVRAWQESKEAASLRRQIAEAFLLFPGKIPTEEFSRFVAALPDEYILRFPPRDVVKHYISFRNYQSGRPVTILSPREFDYTLTVLTGDHPYLLAQITLCLVQSYLNIREAEVFTHAHGLALDCFLIADTHHLLETDGQKRQFQAGLEEQIARETGLLSREADRLHFAPLPAAQIQISHELLPREGTGILRLECPDHVGLVFRAALTLSLHEASIHSAYIQTDERKLRAECLFVLGREGKVREEKQMCLLEGALLHELTS